MPVPPTAIIRFGVFEADLQTGELRKRGSRIRLQEQPFQVLVSLLEKPGELVTREELQQQLWPSDTFVDFDHGLNTAINKIREVLGDSAARPQYIETLPKRGYRFIAPVEKNDASTETASAAETPASQSINAMPQNNRNAARLMFALLQVMYIVFYVLVLVGHETTANLLETYVPSVSKVLLGLVLLSAILGIATRLYLFSAVAFDFSVLGVKFMRLFPAIAAQDFFWALCPFLAIPVIGVGGALASIAGLLWIPFAQRTLIKMAYQT